MGSLACTSWCGQPEETKLVIHNVVIQVRQVLVQSKMSLK